MDLYLWTDTDKFSFNLAYIKMRAFSLQGVQTSSEVKGAFYSVVTGGGGFSSEVKHRVRKAGHSHSANTGVKNDWSNTSTVPYTPSHHVQGQLYYCDLPPLDSRKLHKNKTTIKSVKLTQF
jgi:hypothetical protein